MFNIDQNKIVLFVCAVVFFIANVDVTITNIVLPAIAKQFSIDILDTNIIVVVFLIAYAMSIPLVEFVSNRIGLRNTLLLASFLFAISSLCCGLSHTIYQLAFFRIIQGIAAGFFTPTTRSVVASISDEKSLAINLTNVQTLGILGQAVGPIFGVYLLQWFGWQSVFYLNIPLCLLVLGFVFTGFKAKALNVVNLYPFDYRGYLIVSSSIVLIFLLMFDFEHGIYYNRNIMIMLTGLAFMLIILSWHIKFYLGTHIINFNLLFRNIKLRKALWISFLARQYTGVIPFFVILFFHQMGLSNRELGYLMLSYAIGLWVAKFAFKQLIKKFNLLEIIKHSLIFLFVFNMISCGVLIVSHQLLLSLLLLFVAGVITSVFFSAINLYTLSSIEKSDTMSTSTLMSIMMYISSSTSIALFVVIAALVQMLSASHYVVAEILLSIFLLWSFLLSRQHLASTRE